jgi:dienelactone hydrolase
MEKSRVMRLGDNVPSLVIHPDWESGTPVPGVIWMHGRTVYKELDPGRYQRWVRAGIGAIALDLPGHGERLEETYQGPEKTLDLIAQARGEIDGVLQSIRESGRFDMSRLMIGGMSAGGMVTLSRLCLPHPFIGACVECTTGNLKDLYTPPPGMPGRPWPVEHDPMQVARYDPIAHIGAFDPIPLLALHIEGDEMIPISGQRKFLDALRAHYTGRGFDTELVKLETFRETGAPQEHSGFGRYANDAKNIQLEFIKRVMGVD